MKLDLHLPALVIVIVYLSNINPSPSPTYLIDSNMRTPRRDRSRKPNIYVVKSNSNSETDGIPASGSTFRQAQYGETIATNQTQPAHPRHGILQRRKSLVKPERLATPRRLLLRNVDTQPPVARLGATRTPLRALPLATDDQLPDRQKPFSPITSPTAYVPANQDTFDRLDNNHSEYYDQCKDDLEAPRLVVEQIATYKIAPRPSLPPLDWWTKASRTLTACFCPVCLDACNIKGSVGQQAWREKVTLCMIIAMIMALVGYFTLGLKVALCNDMAQSLTNLALNQSDLQSKPYRDEQVIIQGTTFGFKDVADMLKTRGNIDMTIDFNGQDISRLFAHDSDACSAFVQPKPSSVVSCAVPNPFPASPPLAPAKNSPCPSMSWLQDLTPISRLFYDWKDVAANTRNVSVLYVYSNAVMDLAPLFQGEPFQDASQKINGDTFNEAIQVLNINRGKDVTLYLSRSADKLALVHCLLQRYTSGYLGSQSAGCSAYNMIMSFAFSVILGVILIRFTMALIFHWVVSPKLTSLPTQFGRKDVGYLHPPLNAAPLEVFSAKDGFHDSSLGYNRIAASSTDPYTIMLVTCYSESEASIRSTLDSLAATEYLDDRKLIFVIADGLIKGDGNLMSTPDCLIQMIEHAQWAGVPEAKGYLAIAHGEKQHNMAKVYAGYYSYAQKRVPIILVVKCGTPQEQDSTKKPGNRGKRDSQLILINFLSRVTFNDRMTPLDYDIFYKIQGLSNMMPDVFELLLMVDADTFVHRDSLRHMVQAMKNDERVMGLCGETRIANKNDSWVTMIQVYEYFTSHNLGKAFESLFGGVTCLPGCFCMYRIKSRKGKSIVPLIVNPDVVEEYSENVVDTLHKKNLLLLGEDRFLSTLMLRNFPKRRMVFVPQALCHTTVPDKFRVLLSQRRRWINSTIHNLLELVLLPDLCGIFCLSMQFVIMLELIGTVALPAAITFMYYLLIEAMVSGKPQGLPLIFLAITLGLPGVLIIITTRKLVYVGWMFVYLVGLPVWNFILPLYAFWHFDDFTWGDTRKVEGESKQFDHSNQEGSYKIGAVQLKKWAEWEHERRLEVRLEIETDQKRFRQFIEDSFISPSNMLADMQQTTINSKMAVTSTLPKLPNISGVPVKYRGPLPSSTLKNLDMRHPSYNVFNVKNQLEENESLSDSVSNHVRFALESFDIPDISEITEEPSDASANNMSLLKPNTNSNQIPVAGIQNQHDYMTRFKNLQPSDSLATAHYPSANAMNQPSHSKTQHLNAVSFTVPKSSAIENRPKGGPIIASGTAISNPVNYTHAAGYDQSFLSESYLSAPTSHSLHPDVSNISNSMYAKNIVASTTTSTANEAPSQSSYRASISSISTRDSGLRVIGPRPMPLNIAQSFSSHNSTSIHSRNTTGSDQTIRRVPAAPTNALPLHDSITPNTAVKEYLSESLDLDISHLMQDSTMDESVSLGELANFQFSNSGGSYLFGMEHNNIAPIQEPKPAYSYDISNREQWRESSTKALVGQRYGFGKNDILRSDVCYSPLDFDDSGEVSMDTSLSLDATSDHKSATSFLTVNESDTSFVGNGYYSTMFEESGTSRPMHPNQSKSNIGDHHASESRFVPKMSNRFWSKPAVLKTEDTQEMSSKDDISATCIRSDRTKDMRRSSILTISSTHGSVKGPRLMPR
ncbi:ATP-dependent RNA helicase [Batrachochytrium dendrobatidis]